MLDGVDLWHMHTADNGVIWPEKCSLGKYSKYFDDYYKQDIKYTVSHEMPLLLFGAGVRY